MLYAPSAARFNSAMLSLLILIIACIARRDRSALASVSSWNIRFGTRRARMHEPTKTTLWSGEKQRRSHGQFPWVDSFYPRSPPKWATGT